MYLLTGCGVAISIVNIFTYSSYAPYLGVLSADEITHIRRGEDQSVIGYLGGKVTLIDLGPKRCAAAIWHSRGRRVARACEQRALSAGSEVAG